MNRALLLVTVCLIAVSVVFLPFESSYSRQFKHFVGSEPELYMNVDSSLETWYRDYCDRPVAHYLLYIVVGNSGNASACFINVNFSIQIEDRVIENGLIPFGNLSKGESKNTTEMFELGDGYYEVSLTLESPSRIWDTFTDTFMVNFPRNWEKGFGDFVRFYITPDDPAVQSQVETVGKDVNSLYAWVGDNIHYINDSDIYGVRDHWQLPYETLNLTTGDCEDQAFLLCSLIRASDTIADDVFVALGTVDGGGHAWVIVKTIGGWTVFEPTQEGIIERFLVDLFEFFGLIDREYYFAANDLYFEEFDHATNEPYVSQSFQGWYEGSLRLDGTRITVRVGHEVTLKINITNPGSYVFIGFVKIEIKKDIVWGTDLIFIAKKYSLTLDVGKSQELEFTFVPNEVTEGAIWKCRHYYYKVYTCFVCIHDPTDAGTRECLFVTLETDLNKDGIVNTVDISIVAKAFGSKPGDPHWNEIADLDNNGKITIIDVAKAAKEFGKTV